MTTDSVPVAGGMFVDELRAGLELATDEELQTLTEILFRRKFNPLDYVCTPEPLEVQSRDRQDWIDTLEKRFRFLAADGITVLQCKTAQVSYRQVLIQVCRYLKISYSHGFSTAELEAEIFLTLLNRAWDKLSPAHQMLIRQQLQDTLSQSQLAKQLPATSLQDPIALVLKGGSAFALNSLLAPWVLHNLARQFALHAATYHMATEALVRVGAATATGLENQVALQVARRSMAVSAARYGAVRSVFAVLGPALWVWFFADLGWRAIATNYGRIIPVIFTLAQIRLTRSDFSDCFDVAAYGV